MEVKFMGTVEMVGFITIFIIGLVFVAINEKH